MSGLRARGVEVEEVVPCGASPEEQAASGEDPLPDHLRYDAIVVDALARVVCFSHLDRWRSDRPVLAMVHELQSVAGPPEDAEREEVYEQPLLRADRLVTVSGHGASILEARRVPLERICIVPPGSDGQGPGEERTPAHDASPPRVICVAQWIPRKGILELARAWRESATGEAVLELFGETDADILYAAEVRKAIGDDPSVVVRGAVSDAEVRAAYLAADAFALPSRYEGYGIVYAEAQLFGLPIVACDTGPVPELVGRDTALLVSPDDAGALVEALERIIGNPALRARMSSAALRRAAGLPRWEDTVAGFHEAVRAGRSG